MIEFEYPMEFYQSRSMKVLTPEERDLYLSSNRQSITIEIDAEDHEFIKKHNLNISRIGYFIFKKWIQKKRKEWGV